MMMGPPPPPPSFLIFAAPVNEKQHSRASWAILWDLGGAKAFSFAMILDEKGGP
jgi:hypothetical protein